jgi:putative glutamine amidotransferase
MTKPLIAIPGRISPEAAGQRSEVAVTRMTYIDAVRRAGGIPFVIPPSTDADVIAASLNACSGVLLLGGGDVNPTQYGQSERAQLYGVNNLIDEFELIAVRHALSISQPILAVCRGLQILNVALGGTLVQHLESTRDHRDTMHEVQLVAGSRTAIAMKSHSPLVHSFHHQAIEQVGAGLQVVGTHLDGTIEAAELEGDPWVVGVQWHPEDTAETDSAHQGLFDALVAQCS